MKKILLIIILLATACNLNNTPTSKIEELFSKYQSLNKEIKIDYKDLVGNKDISEEHQKKIEKLIKKQYQNLSYEIKEEAIDGDTATVTAEIEVLNYKDKINEYINNNDHNKDIINELKKEKEKTT